VSRHCWTCGVEHDLDAACRRASRQRTHTTAQAAGRDDDLFDDAEDTSPFGPIFTATFESEDACCGEGIVPGEDIRADGFGGWIHADTTCERLAQ